MTGDAGSRGTQELLRKISLNNNRGNNRRRGRGNNRQQGQQVNRVDSRARGNAQQLLDKYKKLAHDAHLNGDRVQEEYYLQFADHYFRVLADQRQRQEDARQRRDERPHDGGDYGRMDESRDRDRDRDRDDDDDDGDEDVDDAGASAGAGRSRPVEKDADQGRAEEDQIYEPAENPFVRERDNSASRPPARPRKPRRSNRDEAPATADGDTPELNLGVDPAVLPPSIGSEKAVDAPEVEAKPRRRTRKPKASDDNSSDGRPADDSGEKLETIS